MGKKHWKQLNNQMSNDRKMTKEIHLKLSEVWWDGELEVKTRDGWMRTSSPPLASDDPRNYRIRPKPNLRPWKPEEVPVGAEICFRVNPGWRCMIVSCSADSVKFIDKDICTLTFEALLKYCLHSIDGGKTWHPCGVEDES